MQPQQQQQQQQYYRSVSVLDLLINQQEYEQKEKAQQNLAQQLQKINQQKKANEGHGLTKQSINNQNGYNSGLQQHQQMSLTLRKPQTSQMSTRMISRAQKSNSVIELNNNTSNIQFKSITQRKPSIFNNQSQIQTPILKLRNQVPNHQQHDDILSNNSSQHFLNMKSLKMPQSLLMSPIAGVQTNNNLNLDSMFHTMDQRQQSKLKLANSFINKIRPYKQNTQNELTSIQQQNVRRASINSRVSFDLNQN
eukprot:403359474